MRLRETLYAVVRRALDVLDAPAAAIDVEDRGDAVLALVAPVVPKTELVAVVPALVAALGEHNARTGLDEWLRVRVTLHAGEVRRDADGWASRDLTHTFRLGGAHVVKDVLRLAPRAQSVVVCSEQFYRAVVEHGDLGVDPATCRAVDVPGLGAPTRAWVHVPGYARPPLPPPEPTGSSVSAGRAGGERAGGDSWLQGASFTAQRDVNTFRDGGAVNNGDRGPVTT